MTDDQLRDEVIAAVLLLISLALMLAAGFVFGKLL